MYKLKAFHIQVSCTNTEHYMTVNSHIYMWWFKNHLLLRIKLIIYGYKLAATTDHTTL